MNSLPEWNAAKWQGPVLLVSLEFMEAGLQGLQAMAPATVFVQELAASYGNSWMSHPATHLAVYL